MSKKSKKDTVDLFKQFGVDINEDSVIMWGSSEDDVHESLACDLPDMELTDFKAKPRHSWYD
jgi:hypothetical protein